MIGRGWVGVVLFAFVLVLIPVLLFVIAHIGKPGFSGRLGGSAAITPRIVETFGGSPPGYVRSANDSSSFALVATLDGVERKNTGDVVAHVRFRLSGGGGDEVANTVLLYAHTSPSRLFVINQQSSPDIYAQSKDIQSTAINVRKDSQTLINTLGKYSGKKIVLTFLALKIQNGQLQKINVINSQTKFISDIRTCNSLYFSYLTGANGSKKLDCVPYSEQVNVENFGL